MALLEVHNLRTEIHSDGQTIAAVDGISFHIEKGETLCVVGESGCGKSMTALSIMGLVPKPFGKITGGQVLFNGQDLLLKKEKELRHIRGNAISMIYQEPMTSLNPVFPIGKQIAEAIAIHQKEKGKAAMDRARHMLELVGIPDPDVRMKEYPHQLSGGMRQRVMIAIGLSCNPQLLIADEPTTALDVTIQAQILTLMRRLKQELGMAMMFITHDLGVVAGLAERVVVMYGGQIVEEGPVKALYKNPLHPYTAGLLQCVPRMDRDKSMGKLSTIQGVVPNADNWPAGCRFNTRCPDARQECVAQAPHLKDMGGRRKCACFFPLDGDKGEVGRYA